MAHPLTRLTYRCATLIVMGLLLPWTTGAFAATEVALVLSDSTAIYQEVAQALSMGLETDKRGWRVRIQPMAERKGPGGEDLVIPLGLKALQGVLAEPASTPVWSLLVPRLTFEKIAAAHQRPLSALYLDQPLSRHIQMLKAALPASKRLGVLLGPSSSALAEPLRMAASAARLEVVSEQIQRTEDLIPALDKFQGQADVLLLLPDPVVLNHGTLRTLLLHTYRLRLPVAAYSIQLIEAGALLALYASPSQIGAEAGSRLRKAQNGGALRLPPPDYPDSYDVAVNRSVAVSMDIRVPVSERVRTRMEAGVER